MLVDTSTLLRTIQLRHPQHEAATHALRILPEQGTELQILPQNLVELWVVATRPEEMNGLGMPPAAVAAELMRVKSMFVLLPETPAIYPVWESLVIQYHVQGKPAHDARIVAGMQVHGITSILTFDKTGFSRYAGISVLHPEDIGTAT